MMAAKMIALLLVGACDGLLVGLPTRAVAPARGGTIQCVSPAWDDALDRVERLLELKAQSGMTYDEISKKLGLTNTYTAQLFLGQAQVHALPGACARNVVEKPSSAGPMIIICAVYAGP